MVFGEPVAPVEVTVTAPLYVPALRPERFEAIESVPEFVPDAGETVSQAELLDAVQFIVPAPVLETLTDWAAGLEPFAVPLKARAVEVRERIAGGGGATVKVTATVLGEPVAPAAAMVTAPE